ncbi:MAG TPA: hypothetical protein PK156_38065 [Polyangium sp.]|nr:hypothetical protein [Polyangium sp.]
MKLNQFAIGLSFVSLFAIAGCGTDAASDPLAGTWSNDKCFGTSSKPADVESCTTELSFSDGLDIELEATWVSLAATATNPGCTTTKVVTGQEWSTDHAKDTFTVAGTGTSTIERSKCVNDEDNLDAVATSDIEIPSGATTYMLGDNDDTLTVQTGSLKGVYTRNIVP